MRSERKFLGFLEVDGFMSEKTLVKTNFLFLPEKELCCHVMTFLPPLTSSSNFSQAAAILSMCDSKPSQCKVNTDAQSTSRGCAVRPYFCYSKFTSYAASL